MNDRNDIDSILNSMFSGGRLNVKSPAAKEAEKSLEAVQRAQEDMSQSLQKSIERMQADMADLERHLESDGVTPQVSNNSGGADQLDAAFEKARAEVLSAVLGQEEFVNSLLLAFKRPFVAGSPDHLPLCRAALLGGDGTGRRSAVESFTASLGGRGC